MSENIIHTLILGGGAAGFFTAINLAEKLPHQKIVILERGKDVLTKVKVSGGGRCNVTHAEFIPEELTKNYPRGEKELLGPFHTFMTGDIMEWFEKRGVVLKTEEDGRMFPVSDSSQTILDCFLSEVHRLGISVLKNHSVQLISKEEEKWNVQTTQGSFVAKNLIVTTGSNPKIWTLLKSLGHSIVAPVPSLFTFNINDERIKDLPGISKQASVKIVSNSLNSQTLHGPLLITHWGMSGPAILKLSAWYARELCKVDYIFEIEVNWLGDIADEACLETLQRCKDENAKQLIVKYPQFQIPKRLWQNLATASKIAETTKWGDISKKQLLEFSEQLTKCYFQVHGKSTFKEEFVTAGGVDLKEVHFKTFESKIHKKLYFAGEVLNIDAVTGGFNFQNAWTGGFIVASSIAEK